MSIFNEDLYHKFDITVGIWIITRMIWSCFGNKAFDLPFRKDILDVIGQHALTKGFVNLSINPVVHGTGDKLALVISDTENTFE